jgi:hypothetical protein
VFIFVPYSHYDEPKTLSYFMQPVCLLNADGGQFDDQVDSTIQLLTASDYANFRHALNYLPG